MLFPALLPYLIIGCGLILGRVGLRPAMLAWGVCMIGALSGLVIAVTILVIGPAHSWFLAAVSALPFVTACMMVIKDLRHPRINDVATDLDNPIAFGAALRARANENRDMTYPEHFKSRARSAYPSVRPLILDEPANQVFERVCHLAESQPGWRITRQDNDSKTVEAEATTAQLRFVDDVIVRVTSQGGKSRVDMRSKSREGLVDAGKNAQRIEMFLKQVLRGAAVGSPQSPDY